MEPTVVLRRYQDSCACHNLSLAHQVEGMKYAEPNKSYKDLRSASRSQHWRFKNRQSRKFRGKYAYLLLRAYELRHLSSRRRRMEEWEEDCDEQDYWDRRIVDREHEESIETLDPVHAYYRHGHNAIAIKSLMPAAYAEEDETGSSDCIETDEPADTELEVEVITTPSWILFLHRSLPQSLLSGDDGFIGCREPTFTWHRNLSGCWELGYAEQDRDDWVEADPYGCIQGPLPLSCGCCSFSTGFYACSCASFPSSWPSPEEIWRGPLLQWMSDETHSAMMRADVLFDSKRMLRKECDHVDIDVDSTSIAQRNMVKRDCEGEWTFVAQSLNTPTIAPVDHDWDRLSIPSSTGSWMVVPGG